MQTNRDAAAISGAVRSHPCWDDILTSSPQCNKSPEHQKTPPQKEQECAVGRGAHRAGFEAGKLIEKNSCLPLLAGGLLWFVPLAAKPLGIVKHFKYVD